jgi:hypothetical protein
MRIFGKENNEPEVPVQAQDRTLLSNSHSFPPHVFYDPTFNPLYNPSISYYNRPSKYEYSPSFNDDLPTTSGLTSDFHGDFKPLDSTPRGHSEPSQEGYSAGPRNASGGGMHFGM